MNPKDGVLLDVEGTTTPIAFVHETLFPFARERLEEACARASEDPRLADAMAQLRKEHAEDGSVVAFGDGSAYARHLMDLDRKSTGLKMLQGVIWETGYRSGALAAPVFDDVPVAFSAWKEAGKRIHIYSSGSVLAQKLLFAHTNHGDLTPYIDGYHDTRVGPKREAASYRKIRDAMGVDSERILFLSDIPEELDAAREASMQTGLMLRPGNRPADPGPHPAFETFHSLMAS